MSIPTRTTPTEPHEQHKQLSPPTRRYDYERDGQQIYRRSFATIRAEAHLDHLPESARVVAVRMVHASGDVDLTQQIAVHPLLVSTARAALESGAAIFTDAGMLASGVTRARLPRDLQGVHGSLQGAGLRSRRVHAADEEWHDDAAGRLQQGGDGQQAAGQPP